MEQKLRRDLNIGMNLRRLRIEHGYSQESLCVELQRRGIDIGRSAYQKYEEGRLNVKISVLIALKHLYGCTYDDFFSGLCRSFIWFYTSQLVQIQINQPQFTPCKRKIDWLVIIFYHPVISLVFPDPGQGTLIMLACSTW